MYAVKIAVDRLAERQIVNPIPLHIQVVTMGPGDDVSDPWIIHMCHTIIAYGIGRPAQPIRVQIYGFPLCQCT